MALGETGSDTLANARRFGRACAVPVFVLAAGADGDPLTTARIDANDALAVRLGRAAACGASAAAWLGDDWAEVATALSPLFTPGAATPDHEDASIAVTLSAVDGRGGPLVLNATPLAVSSRVVGVMAAVAAPLADGDAVLRMEEAMRAEIERTTAARSRFLASASHDLRQPFQAMRLFLDALCSQIADEKALETAEMLGNAMTAGERLLNSLLDISTLDAGTVKPDIQAVALDDILGQIVEEFRPLASEKGLRIRARLCRGTAVTDAVLFGRIVRNLLSNAIRYTQRGGLLLAMRRRGDCWRIDVWDTGFGIPEGQLSAVFDEFHQLQNPNRDPTRGLGLGLAIVRRLSDLLGTPVDVRSRVGRGTTFTVSVQAGPAPVDPEETPDNGRERSDDTVLPLAGLRVLAVDDEAMVLTGLTMILESWGCTVAAAGDMREVFAVLDGLPDMPSVILTDLRLPGTVSGFDVIDRVRRLYGRPIPAIVLSGETAQSALLEGQRRGCSFLHKPLHPGELRRALERIPRD